MILRLSKCNLILVSVLFLLTNSCQKETPDFKTEFEGDTSIFVGLWKWSLTEHYYNWCDPPSFYELLSPNTANVDFEINILKSGQLNIYRNDSLVSNYNLKLVQFFSLDYANLTDAIKFGFVLNGVEDLQFSGFINTDTIITPTLPGFIYNAVDGCELYSNYFVKQ